MIHMDLQDANVLAALIELLADNGPEEEAVAVIRKVSLATRQLWCKSSSYAACAWCR